MISIYIYIYTHTHAYIYIYIYIYIYVYDTRKSRRLSYMTLANRGDTTINVREIKIMI